MQHSRLQQFDSCNSFQQFFTVRCGRNSPSIHFLPFAILIKSSPYNSQVFLAVFLQLYASSAKNVNEIPIAYFRICAHRIASAVCFVGCTGTLLIFFMLQQIFCLIFCISNKKPRLQRSRRLCENRFSPSFSRLPVQDGLFCLFSKFFCTLFVPGNACLYAETLK